ncbi:RnfABCDGE type electron transport complex subunit G [candidate division KSB1 bacterium]|nr:RnfABCDGE type electron transport complex subunit G [candidate division KSB1 bacterium]
MKEIIRYGFILMMVAVVAATGLSAVYNVAKPRIDEQKRLQFEAALATALPGSETGIMEPVQRGDTVLYYRCYVDSLKTELLGYAFRTGYYGYSSEVESIVGIDSSGTILGLKILSQAETPGLGTKIQEIRYGEKDPYFLRQFIGQPAATVSLDKDGGKITAITGATISSRAVTRSILQGYEQMQENLQAER